MSLSLSALKPFVKGCVVTAIPDASDLEIIGAISSIRTSFGLRAVRLASLDASQRKRPVTEFVSDHGFDFRELPRDVLVKQIDASSGLGLHVCKLIVNAIEERTMKELDGASRVTIEGVGVAERHGSEGLRLELDDALRVAGTPEKRDSGKSLALA
jgi:hypothetical protein